MDRETLLTRFGKSLREARHRRGATQADLARLAGITRQKVIQIERGDASVSIGAYADAVAALGMQFDLSPARRPTLDEVRELLGDE